MALLLEPEATEDLVDVVSLEGSQVAFRGPFEFGPVGNSFMSVEFPDGVTQQFTAGSMAMGNSLVRDLGLTLSEHYSYSGGALSLGEMIQADVQDKSERLLSLAVWVGDHGTLITHTYFGGLEALRQRVFDVGIVESALGISLAPVNPELQAQRLYPRAPEITRRIPELGRLRAYELTSSVTTSLPAWPGAIVDGGQVYQAPGATEDSILLYLVTDTALGILEVGNDVSAATALEAIAQVRIDWGEGSRWQ